VLQAAFILIHNPSSNDREYDVGTAAGSNMAVLRAQPTDPTATPPWKTTSGRFASIHSWQSEESKMTKQLSGDALQLRSMIKREGTLELSLATIPIPQPKDDEVLVRVEASSAAE